MMGEASSYIPRCFSCCNASTAIRYALAGAPEALADSELTRSNLTNPALFAVYFFGFPASNIQQIRQRALTQSPNRNAGSCEMSISNTHAQTANTHKAQYHYHAMYG